jgi:hypothetical protein
MSKNNSTEKQSLKENSNIIPQTNNTRQYLINVLIFLLALLIGTQIPKYVNEQKALGGNEFQSQESSVPKSAQPVIDMEKIYKEVSERIRAEINEAQILKERELNQNSNKAPILEKPQDDIINEKVAAKTKIVMVSNEIVEDESAIKIQSDGSPITIDLNKVKNKQAEEEREAQLKKKKIQEAKEKARQAKEKKLQEAKKDEKTQTEKEKMEEDPKVKKEKSKIEKEKREEELKVKEQKSDAVVIPDEIKNFQSTKINQIKTKKMWIPIPGSNGGHRRVPSSRMKLDSIQFFEYLFFNF